MILDEIRKARIGEYEAILSHAEGLNAYDFTREISTPSAVPDPIKDIRPSTCVALYMAVGAAPQIVEQLETWHPGVPFDVQIVAKAQRK